MVLFEQFEVFQASDKKLFLPALKLPTMNNSKFSFVI